MNDHEKATVAWINISNSYSSAAYLLLSESDSLDEHTAPTGLLCAHSLETSLKGLVVFASGGKADPKCLGHDLIKAWNAAKEIKFARNVLEEAQKELNSYWRDRLRGANEQIRDRLEAWGINFDAGEDNFGIVSNQSIGEALPNLRTIVKWYSDRNDAPVNRFRYPWTGLDRLPQATVGSETFDVCPYSAIFASQFICRTLEQKIRSQN